MLTFVTAEVTRLITLDEGELRVVELTMPDKAVIDNQEYALLDMMRPGAAFIAQPAGFLRAYTRSNCSLVSPGILETVINKKENGAKTSAWWQYGGVREGDLINVRVDCNGEGQYFVYEHMDHRYARNLLLEPDEWWSDKQIFCVAYYTGITPFLSWIRYMKAKNFGVVATTPASYPFQRFSNGVGIELLVSVRTEKQLIFHDELLALHREFPVNFSYHPMLTRQWPKNWPFYYRGRIADPKRTFEQGKTKRVDLAPLYGILPFVVESYHIRMCGGKKACNTMTLGLSQADKKSLGVIRQEMW